MAVNVKGQNFTVYRGAFRRAVVRVRDGDGADIDLTGFTSLWEVSLSRSAEIPDVISKIGLPFVNVGPGTNNGVQIDLDEVDTVNLEAGYYWHELRLTDLAADEHIVAVGRLEILPSQTSPPIT